MPVLIQAFLEHPSAEVIGLSTMLIATLDRLQSVLEQGGVMFITPDATGGIGIRLKL